MLKKTIYLLVISTILIACKSSKGIADKGIVKNLTTKKIVKNYTANTTHFNTLKATLKTNYINNLEEGNFTIDIRVKKDEIIWASIKKVGISGAKIYITPNRVQYYNKIDKTYFDGDFSLISNWLGTAITFEQLQAILLGEVLYPLNAKTHESELLEEGYLIKPKEQKEFFEQFITLHPTHFKVLAQEIAQPKDFRILSVDYPNYQEINKQIIPLDVKVTVVEKTTETQVAINFRNVSLNQELRFPFKIPESYKEIILE